MYSPCKHTNVIYGSKVTVQASVQSSDWGTTQAVFRKSIQPPPAALIGNVTIVPFLGEKCVIIELENGKWEVPGGTLERNEHYLDAARRELLEEVGAILLHQCMIGFWECRSLADRPYRPHLPHPLSYRLALLAEVELRGFPTNPPSGEKVKQVECVEVGDALRIFSRSGRDDPADLYRFAEYCRTY